MYGLLLFLQAGGWLRGNRAGIETLIDTTKGMLELVNNVSALRRFLAATPRRL